MQISFVLLNVVLVILPSYKLTSSILISGITSLYSLTRFIFILRSSLVIVNRSLIEPSIFNVPSSNKVNLRGVLIGNGLTDFDTDIERSMVEFGFYHGLISIETYNTFKRHCPHKPDELYPEEYERGSLPDQPGRGGDLRQPGSGKAVRDPC